MAQPAHALPVGYEGAFDIHVVLSELRLFGRGREGAAQSTAHAGTRLAHPWRTLWKHGQLHEWGTTY